MPNLIWLTDIHLNFLTDASNRAILNHVYSKCEPGDTVVITGDIAEAPSVMGFMQAWNDKLALNQVNLKFILGNHDYYRGSVVKLRQKLRDNMENNWLGSYGICELTPNTALIGHDGWYDGLYADYFKSKLMMNDYLLIREFFGLNIYPRHEKIKELSQESADYVYDQGKKALETYSHLFIATHVPPFVEAAYFRGKPSDSDWMPHFSSKLMGDAIQALGIEYPHRKITVLCGHTHVGMKDNHVCRPAINIECHTGTADYSYPRVSDIFTIT